MNQGTNQFEVEAIFKFNIKLTDLSDLENPFVIYENKGID